MIIIDPEKCVGCGNCVPYCTVGAIEVEDGLALVDPHKCTDCYVCVRNDVCPTKAMSPGPLETFNDMFRHILSDPTETTAETGVPGRGTEEAKTNDVTGRFGRDEAGIAIDMGRPGVGVRMADVETVAKAVVKAGLKLESAEHSPLGQVLDIETGVMDPSIKDHYLLSIIVEGKCELSKLGDVLQALRDVEDKVDTVFSVGLVLRTDANGYHPSLKVLDKFGVTPIRGKVNVGLGRPLVP
ncbi:MAG: DUF362 domain-containing protein [Bacillota bacterium]